MPRTRNVSRAQWNAAEAQNENENNPPPAPITRRSTRSSTAAVARPALSSTAGKKPLKSNTKDKKSHSSAKDAVLSQAPRSHTTGKDKGKTKGSLTETRKKKQPLQDITAEILGQVVSIHPGAMPLPEVVVEQTEASPTPNQRLPIPSSLPPSSPPAPSTSSQYQLPLASTHSSSPIRYTGYGADDTTSHIDPWAEFDISLPRDEDGEIHNEPVSSNSDPFGFLALERKLKAEKQAKEEQETGRVLVPSTSDGALHPHGYFRTPTPPMPPTPHKERIGRHARILAAQDDDEELFNPRTESMPSTPSPTKPRARKSIEINHEDEEEGATDGDGETSFDYQMKSRKRTRIGVVADEREMCAREQPKTGSGSPVDPVALAKSLGALLPRRPAARKNLKGKAVSPSESESEREDTERENETTSKRRVRGRGTVKARAAAPASKKNTKGKNKGKAEGTVNGEDDGEIDEKLDRERQERIEYFKRLDGYEVEKEDVYVV